MPCSLRRPPYNLNIEYKECRLAKIYKAVVLELYKRITANSLQVGIAYGSPVLTGRYDASHTIARGCALPPFLSCRSPG
jgi:hypothetical protein